MKVINDLFDYDFKIVQDTDYFKFSLDSLLLAEFVDNVYNLMKILDVCTGNAAIPLVLASKYENQIYGFEIQEKIYDLALESIKINKLEDRIKVYNDDIGNVKKYFPGNIFDVVLANPPYFKYNQSSIINENECKAIARHEIALDLEKLFESVNYIIKNKGCFYLVHLPNRLQEILVMAEKYNFRAKKIQFVYTNKRKDAKIVLVKFVKNGNNDIKVSSPVFINNYKSYKNMFGGD